MTTTRTCLLCIALSFALSAFPARAQEKEAGLGKRAQSLAKRQFDSSMHSKNRPFEPFRVIGNLYYVGTYELALARGDEVGEHHVFC